jgi:hypothetical protein
VNIMRNVVLYYGTLFFVLQINLNKMDNSCTSLNARSITFTLCVCVCV